jgi:hypothetical protein
MRTLFAATVAALALATPAVPAHAVGTGAGVAVLEATSFFRPNTGVVAAGACTYAAAALAADAVGFAVTPAQVSVSIDCWLEDAFGGQWLPVHASGTSAVVAVATGVNTGLPINTPVRVCGTISADSANWGPASQTTCAAVLPGNVKT